MVSQHVMVVLAAPGDVFVLPLGQKKLLVGSVPIALVAADESAIIGLDRIFHVIKNFADGG